MKYQDRKKTKPVFDDKSLALEDVYLVGYGWKKPRKSHVDQWTRSHHMGWRWSGKGKTIPKWTYISGSSPKRKKGKEPENEERERVQCVDDKSDP